MDQRISFITLAVRDVAASHAFYVEGLGWEPALHVPGEVVMIQTGQHLLLSLWDREAFTAETGHAPPEGTPPVTLAHNVATTAEVDEILALASTLGATTTGPEAREWGGYTGYFSDPDGFLWEIAHNPGEIGRLVLP
jgi:catechol 2,3-dioxygenase-like lactoylglutathione lyase family enzyme